MSGVLRTYPDDGLRGIVNESLPGFRPGFRPGDVVRPELFDDDRGRPSRDFPVGLVVWVRRINSSDAVGILWSGDPK